MALDLERVLADQVGRDGLVQVRLDRLRAEKGLAQSDDALVGVDTHPEDIGELVHPDRLEFRDLHEARPGSRQVGAGASLFHGDVIHHPAAERQAADPFGDDVARRSG